MSQCKLCTMLPNEELQSMLLTKSSRYIADRFDIGRTTVNKHRKQCMGVYVPKSTDKKMFEEENQSIEWNGNTGVWNTGLIASGLSDMSPETILEQFGHDANKVAIRGVIRESHKEYWSRDLNTMLWKHSYSFAIERKQDNEDAGFDTDEWALANNFVSVVPVQFDLTAHHAMSHINQLLA